MRYPQYPQQEQIQSTRHSFVQQDGQLVTRF